MLGIQLRSVAVACNTISRLILSDMKMRAKMPLLLVQIEASFLSLNLYENGQLTFSRFASIDPEDYENSEDYIFEAVNENIFRMFQFQRQRSSSSPIQNVIFYGDTTEFIRLTNALEQMDIRTGILGVPGSVKGYENIEFQSYANAIGAMFRSDKSIERINLLELDAAVGRSNAGAGFLVAVLLSLVISAGCVAAAFAYFRLRTNQINKDIGETQAQMDSPEMKKRLAAVDDTETRIQKLNLYGDALKTADLNFRSQPKFTSEILEQIEENLRPFRAEWMEMSYSQGFISLTIVASNYLDPAQIAATFVEQDIFDNVTYTGFSYDDSEEGSSHPYSFDMTIQVREKPEFSDESETVEEEVVEE
jgi:type IV pilus assembly protein PilM